MAVPKNKRYKQVVKTRRSLQKLNLILKKHLAITKFNNHGISTAPLYDFPFLKTMKKPVRCLCIPTHLNNSILTLCAKCFRYWIKIHVLRTSFKFDLRNVSAFDADWYFPFLGWKLRALDAIKITPFVPKFGQYPNLCLPKKILKYKNKI